jgi:hypothetical protein
MRQGGGAGAGDGPLSPPARSGRNDSAYVVKKCQDRLVIVKIEFHFFVLFLKPKRTKIFALNDFRVFFNSAHFSMT